MNVRELARLLEEWPANEATVVISDGGGSLSWVFRNNHPGAAHCATSRQSRTCRSGKWSRNWDF